MCVVFQGYLLIAVYLHVVVAVVLVAARSCGVVWCGMVWCVLACAYSTMVSAHGPLR